MKTNVFAICANRHMICADEIFIKCRNLYGANVDLSEYIRRHEAHMRMAEFWTAKVLY